MALLLASIAAYGVAALALKPVEAMRSRAARSPPTTPDQRLPVPPTGDEVARSAKTLNEMLERLADALAHERAFVADASHELRTPLAIFRTELELALARGRSPTELRPALASAAEETDRLNQLSEDLLTIAQTERGELPLRLASVRSGEMLAGGRAQFRSPRPGRAGGGSRSPPRPGSTSAPTASASTRRSATSSTTPCATAAGRSSCRPRGGGPVEIDVLDRRRRVYRRLPPRAFERFSRASSSARDGGSGLGLAIVRPSPAPTAARPTPATAAAAAPTSGWPCRQRASLPL